MDPRVYLVFLVVFGGIMVVLRPLAAALADRIRRPAVPPGEDQQELVDEVRAMRQELAELAERVDFTERLIARTSDPARVDQKEG